MFFLYNDDNYLMIENIYDLMNLYVDIHIYIYKWRHILKVIDDVLKPLNEKEQDIISIDIIKHGCSMATENI